MATIVRTWLIGLLSASSILSCVELKDPSPSTLRLKSTDNIKYGGFPFGTEYTYDVKGRVASFITSMGTKGLLSYDEKNRYKQLGYFYRLADEKDGETTSFSYNTSDDNFTTTTDFVKNGSYGGNLQSVQYKLDGNKRLIAIYTNSVSGKKVEMFEYTNDNITHMQSTDGGGLDVTFDYDDKLNPYYGLIAPDIGPTRRFSRNNVTRIITNGRVSAEVSYEYNSQDLPVRLIEKNGPGEVRYTYELAVQP